MLLFLSFKNIIFILGVVLLLRLIGKMMAARRNIDSQNQYQQKRTDINVEKEKAKRNFGRTTIEKIDKNATADSDYTDYEEIND